MMWCTVKIYKPMFGALVLIVVYLILQNNWMFKSGLRIQFPEFLDKFSNSTSDNCTADFKSHHFVTAETCKSRTGNRLFRLATLIAAADDACYTAVYDSDNFGPISTIFQPITNVLPLAHDMKVSSFEILRERGCMIYSGPLARNLSTSPRRNWKVLGYRVSYKYFQHKKELIRFSFVFKAPIKIDVSSFLTNYSLFNKTKVSIHVRRGDFQNEGLQRRGFVVSSLEYIYKAISYFRERHEDKQLVFIVVTDDMKWCRDNIKSPDTVFSPFTDVGRDLYLLTQCDYSILTTGTFGWMGAWLNETGTVVYDQSFPRPGSGLWREYRKEDYYPPWWIGM